VCGDENLCRGACNRTNSSTEGEKDESKEIGTIWKRGEKGNSLVTEDLQNRQSLFSKPPCMDQAVGNAGPYCRGKCRRPQLKSSRDQINQ